MFSVWKEKMLGTVAYVGKDGIKEVKVKGAFVKLVYLYLQQCGDGNPSYNAIAEDTELSRSIVIRCVKVLEEKGLIHKKTRPTDTLYHKSNVYSIHQSKSSSDVQHTPSSLKDLKSSISIDTHMQNFNKVNQKWNACFARDLYLSEYMTLVKQSNVYYLCDQIQKIQDNHHDISTIADPGKYVYSTIARGGYQVVEKPAYTPQNRPIRYKRDKKAYGLCKSEINRMQGISVSKYTPEQIAEAKARIKHIQAAL